MRRDLSITTALDNTRRLKRLLLVSCLRSLRYAEVSKKMAALLLMPLSTIAVAAEPVVIGSSSVEPLSTANLTQWTIGLVFVLLMILAVAWFVKRFTGVGSGGYTGQLQILSGVSLGSREKAVLIRAGKQHLLLGVAPGRVETLHTFNEGEIIESAVDAPIGFQESLNKIMNKKAAE